MTNTDILSTYDVVDITDDNAESLGYSPLDRGLVVQRDGQWILGADDLDSAARLIRELTGIEITLVRDPACNYGDRWVPQRVELTGNEA
jgi:hypothetical protein